MNLNVNNWQWFTLGKLFTIKKGKRLTAADQEDGINNYIGAIDSNNGVANHIAQTPIHKGNTISLSYNGSVGEAFYQDEPYWATDDVNALYCKYAGFNQYIGLFVVTILRKEKYKFSYGRKWTLENMNNTRIKLPVLSDSEGIPVRDATVKYSDDGYIPDWQFMENYIKSLHHKPLTTCNKRTGSFSISGWKDFRISSVLKIKNGKGITKEEIADNSGDFAVVQSGEENNGVLGTISLNYCKSVGYVYSEEPCLTVARSGSAGFVSFQRDGCVVGDSAKILYLDSDIADIRVYLFLQTILTANRFKYAYGRKVTEDKYMSDTIKLPIKHNPDGTPVIDAGKRFSENGHVPDWEYMKDYITALPYGDRI